MWDVSAALSPPTGGRYADIDKRIDEAIERGFNAVRIEAFPILKYPPSGEAWNVLTSLPPIPLQLTVPWTAYGGFTVRPHERTEYILECLSKRGMNVILTTWAPEFFPLFEETGEFLQRILSLSIEERIHALAAAWKRLLRDYAKMGLLDAVAYVELHNEANVAFIEMPGLRDNEEEMRRVYRTMGEATQEISDVFPSVPVGCSFTGDWNSIHDFVPAQFDVLGFHPWINGCRQVQETLKERRIDDYRVKGYEPPQVPPEDAWRYPPFLYEFYGIDKTKMNEFYRDMAERCRDSIRDYLRDTIVSVKQRADDIGALSALSEGYSVPWIYEGVNWGWIKEICSYAIEQAAALEFYAVTTCNFSSPMFSLWDDTAWHQRMNRTLGGEVPFGKEKQS